MVKPEDDVWSWMSGPVCFCIQPHHWSSVSDTQLDIAHLTKAGVKEAAAEVVSPTTQTLLQDILGLEDQHIAGKPYGGMRPHSR